MKKVCAIVVAAFLLIAIEFGVYTIITNVPQKSDVISEEAVVEEENVDSTFIE